VVFLEYAAVARWVSVQAAVGTNSTLPIWRNDFASVCATAGPGLFDTHGNGASLSTLDVRSFKAWLGSAGVHVGNPVVPGHL